jgi:hypothetical protein
MGGSRPVEQGKEAFLEGSINRSAGTGKRFYGWILNERWSRDSVPWEFQSRMNWSNLMERGVA